MNSLAMWARLKSPWVIHFNSGACNGCDIEIVALLTPKYDVERFGIKLEPSPRHADVLLVTGAVTKQCTDRLKRIYDQMPQPKFVVAIGACACSGGVFQGTYGVEGGVDKVIPVNAYIPGCPPRPEAIIDGVVKLLNSLTAPPAPKAAVAEGSPPPPTPAAAPSPVEVAPKEVKEKPKEEKPNDTK
jgi:NADH-quinone oxidoreductase B subunit